MTVISMKPREFRDPLPDYISDVLVRLANEGLPNEICGFVMYSPRSLFIVPCDNVHKNPTHYFEVDHDQLAAIYEDEPFIVGMYHSHPNGPDKPSQADRKYAPDQGIRYFIVTKTHVFEYNTETWEAVV